MNNYKNAKDILFNDFKHFEEMKFSNNSLVFHNDSTPDRYESIFCGIVNEEELLSITSLSSYPKFYGEEIETKFIEFTKDQAIKLRDYIDDWIGGNVSSS